MNRISQFFKSLIPFSRVPSIPKEVIDIDKRMSSGPSKKTPRVKKSKRSRLSNHRRMMKRRKAKELTPPRAKFGGTFTPFKHITVRPFGRIQRTGMQKYQERMKA